MKIRMELIGIQLSQFGDAKNRDVDLTEGTSLADALSGIGVSVGGSTLAMVNGAAVHYDQWPETALKADDVVSLFRPFKGG